MRDIPSSVFAWTLFAALVMFAACARADLYTFSITGIANTYSANGDPGRSTVMIWPWGGVIVSVPLELIHRPDGSVHQDYLDYYGNFLEIGGEPPRPECVAAGGPCGAALGLAYIRTPSLTLDVWGRFQEDMPRTPLSWIPNPRPPELTFCAPSFAGYPNAVDCFSMHALTGPMVPEPATLALFGSALFGMLVAARSRRRERTEMRK